MRVLILDTYYPAFLRSFYDRNADLTHRSYREQWRTLMDQCFGTADFYSTNLNQLGHEATEVITNCEVLQRQWASENGVRLDQTSWTLGRRRGWIPWPQHAGPPDWFYTVLMAQIKQYHPDVLYVQEMNSFTPAFLREFKPYVKLIAGQIAFTMSAGADYREYDLILSSFPHYVSQFRRDGLNSEYLRLSFEPKVLERLEQRIIHDAVFVGSVSTEHGERIEFLEKVASYHPLDFWGHGVDALSPTSLLRGRYHGDAWALDMYQLLRNAKIALNNHIDTAGEFANNMRLFEATGVGTLLITDWKVNLHEMFDLGAEVVTYSTPEECGELIKYYLDRPAEREAIARAGQRRTLREHTYYMRMQELVEILKSHLA